MSTESTTPKASESAVRSPVTRMQTGTVVGVDVGLRALLALAPHDTDPAVTRGFRVDGGSVLDDYTRICDRYESDGVVPSGRADRLRSRLDAAVTAAMDYVESFETPVLVVEDVSYPRQSLAESAASGVGAPAWAMPAVAGRLVERARAGGIPVALTDAYHTTKNCHVCGQPASIGTERMTCSIPECPAGSVDRDLSAAATIARRLLD